MSTTTLEIDGHPVTVSSSLADQNLSRLHKNTYQTAAIVGVLGLTTAFVVGLCAGDGMQQFWLGYLLAACFFTSISLGAFGFTALQHLTRAGWSVVVRRLAESFAVSIKICAFFFVPIVISVLCGVSSLYEWNNPELVRTDPLIQGKVPYLNAGFFALRQVIYFGIWIYIANKFWFLSLAQDKSGDPQITHRLEAISAPTMLVYALTLTFASIDWLMSLDPHWFSTIYGVYLFSGSMMAFLATTNLLVYVMQQRMGLLPMITVEHRHDLGKLMFGFMCFWAYIAFSQYLLIWYANIPEETVWFQVRQSPGWAPVSIALAVGHFFLPFLGLMPRSMKRNPKTLAAWSLVLLIMHAVDLYWLIFPNFEPQGPTLPLLSIAALMGVGGLYVAGWLIIVGDTPLVPLKDPRLPESMAFHNI